MMTGWVAETFCRVSEFLGKERERVGGIPRELGCGISVIDI